MKTSYEMIVNSEGFDWNAFKSAVKEMNESGLLPAKINVIGITKEKAVEKFLNAIEKIPEEDVQKMPDIPYKLNNNFIDILDISDSKDGEEAESSGEKLEIEGKITKTKEEKSEIKEEKAETKKKKEVNGIDEFGFIVGSKNNLFVKAIKNKPMKMAEIKKMSWNKKGGTFYEVSKKLIEKGVMGKSKDGIFNIKGSLSSL